ncbi:hypothetical protein, partial [Herbaspirillum sp. SJZ099]|uniref:hypothetical protein n=1 Tax=Herbaspirillum sp. SJZ099 TaxID=2572916 RepID=UPI001C972121
LGAGIFFELFPYNEACRNASAGAGLAVEVGCGGGDWINYFSLFLKKYLRGMWWVAIVRPLLTRHTKRREKRSGNSARSRGKLKGKLGFER